MEIGEFHHTNGLYFKRNEDGSVRIRFSRAHVPDITHTIPPNEWASVVAVVSPIGETGESYARAKALHGFPAIRTVYVDDQPVQIQADAATAQQVLAMAHIQPTQRLALIGDDTYPTATIPRGLVFELRDGMRFETRPQDDGDSR